MNPPENDNLYKCFWLAKCAYLHYVFVWQSSMWLIDFQITLFLHAISICLLFFWLRVNFFMIVIIASSYVICYAAMKWAIAHIRLRATADDGRICVVNDRVSLDYRQAITTANSQHIKLNFARTPAMVLKNLVRCFSPAGEEKLLFHGRRARAVASTLLLGLQSDRFALSSLSRVQTAQVLEIRVRGGAARVKCARD